jgi:hypothetical protein
MPSQTLKNIPKCVYHFSSHYIRLCHSDNKLDNNIPWKQIYRSISIMNMGTRIINFLASTYLKRIMHHEHIELFLGMEILFKMWVSTKINLIWIQLRRD